MISVVRAAIGMTDSRFWFLPLSAFICVHPWFQSFSPPLCRKRQTIEAERGVSLFDDAHEFEISDALRKRALAEMLHNDARFGYHNRGFAECFEGVFVFAVGSVRRVEEN